MDGLGPQSDKAIAGQTGVQCRSALPIRVTHDGDDGSPTRVVARYRRRNEGLARSYRSSVWARHFALRLPFRKGALRIHTGTNAPLDDFDHRLESRPDAVNCEVDCAAQVGPEWNLRLAKPGLFRIS